MMGGFLSHGRDIEIGCAKQMGPISGTPQKALLHLHLEVFQTLCLGGEAAW